MSYACLSLSDVLCDCALHSLVFHPVLPAVTQRSETVGCLQGKILKASRFPPGAPSRIKKHLTTPPPTLRIIFLPQREVVVSLGGAFSAITFIHTRPNGQHSASLFAPGAVLKSPSEGILAAAPVRRLHRQTDSRK